MTKVELFKFIHVLAAMVWVGGGATVAVVAFRMKTADPLHRLGFARDMRFISTWIFLPAALVAYVFGSLMVEEVEAFDYEQTWIAIGTIGIFVTFLTLSIYLVPRIRKAVKLMEAGKGPEAGALMRKITIVSRFNLSILFVVVWAMVTKPGL